MGLWLTVAHLGLQMSKSEHILKSQRNYMQDLLSSGSDKENSEAAQIVHFINILISNLVFY